MLLNCHTYYSLKYGALSVEQLYETLRACGHEAFVLADINNTSACMDALRLAPKYGIHPVLGIDFRNGVKQQYVAIAKNNEGFRELTTHLSLHLHQGKPFPDRAPKFENAYVVYPMENGVNDAQLLDHEYIGVRPHQLSKLYLTDWRYKQDKLVVLQTASFRNKRDFNAHRLLRAIHNNMLLSRLPANLHGTPQDRFMTMDELLGCFSAHPQVVQNTFDLLENCRMDMDFSTNKNKNPFTQSMAQDYELLRSLSHEGIHYRYGQDPPKEVLQRLKKELEMIHRLEFCSYFLINWDMIRYAQRKNYYHVGRGSGANSLVAYLLQITDVDPTELDLYFERFINPFRSVPPDFDIDFSWTDRDDVIRYLFETHGYGYTALVGTYNRFKYHSVFRELGKVFGLPAEDISKFQRDSSASLDDQYGKYVVEYTDYISGFPSHLSVHASGVVISQQPINSYTATFMPPKGFPTIQFNMHTAEDIGLHKFDILSQRGLGKIRDSLEIIHYNRKEEVDIHDVNRFKEDVRVKELLKTGKTIGCFYVESPAMRMLLTKLEAEDYLRLVAASSIIRPGVAKSGMMREYILRFQDKKRREAACNKLPELYELLEETYGVMVYQEDVIKVAHSFAGLTLGEADVLRRGMSWSYRDRSDFRVVKDKFFSNCKSKGYDHKTVNEIWEQIESFANYAFAKGHSASYAIESFQALYLKAYYPLEYMVATLNNGGGFYRTELYLHEARLHGGLVEAPCVNESDYLTVIKDKTIYLGVIFLNGLERSASRNFLSERKARGNFVDLRDFIKRVPISLEQLIILIRAGGFRFTGKDKKQLLWDAHFMLGHKRKTQPTTDLFEVEVKDFQLPELWYHELETAFDQMELLGFPLCSPFKLLEHELSSELVSADLPGLIGKQVEIVGYLIHRKHTQTHKGTHMNFGTFLDLDGQWLDTVHFPQVAARFPFRGPGCYIITGKVTEEFGFISVEVSRLKRLDNRNMETPSSRLRSMDSYYRKPLKMLNASA